jgi:hypothetical protein
MIYKKLVMRNEEGREKIEERGEGAERGKRKDEEKEKKGEKGIRERER